jgi:hypothetical protein
MGKSSGIAARLACILGFKEVAPRMSEKNVPAKVVRTVDEATRKAAELYADNTALRTFIVSIPYLGGGIDMIIATEGQKVTKERIFKLIDEMKQRMEQHEEEAINKEYLASDEFIDLVIKAFDSAAKTRNEEKIRLYARILTESTVRDKQGTYFPEEYLNVLAGLTPRQVEVAWAIYEVQVEPREERHPEGGEGWHQEKEQVRKKLNLDGTQLVFMLKSLVAAGLVAEIGRTTPGTIAIEYSITPAFKEMMDFLDISK